MSPSPAPLRPRQSGFVLIGVVMFVMALAIIGLSLYSLSSYEAGFLERSISQQQAFQSALGGIELAKFKLAATSSLARAVDACGTENVTAAVAIQSKVSGPDSTGNVIWDPAYPILVRVTTRVPAGSGFAEQRLEAQFLPLRMPNYYSQVITTSNRLSVVPLAGANPLQSTWTDRRYTVNLGGRVWEAAQPPDTSWKEILGPTRPAPILSETGVPDPAVAAYLVSHPVSGMQLVPPYVWAPSPVPPYDITLTGGSTPTYYRESVDTGDLGYSLYYMAPNDPQDVTIRVSGRVVWVLEHGMRFEQEVKILHAGNPAEDCLVIVAGPSTDPQQYPNGIFFFGGLYSEVPLVLVSSGRVLIDHLNNPDGSSTCGDLSIFAKDVQLVGPNTTALPNTMTLLHDSGGLLETSHLPALATMGALPNVTSASDRKLAFVAGSWRDSLP